MKTKELKEKLKDNFEKILEDESKLEILDSTFSKIITEIKASSETEIHNGNNVESTQKTTAKKSEVKSWDDFKKKMKAKYGF